MTSRVPSNGTLDYGSFCRIDAREGPSRYSSGGSEAVATTDPGSVKTLVFYPRVLGSGNGFHICAKRTEWAAGGEKRGDSRHDTGDSRFSRPL